MEEKIRILLVDDHEMLRRGVRAMLELELDIEVVGECDSAEELVSRVERLSPDIVLMDIRMPGVDGIEACRRLRSHGLACNVIMLSLYEEYLTEAIKAGAVAYLPKDIKRSELVQTIRRVHWNGRPTEEEGSAAPVEEVELVILSPAEAAQLASFIDLLQPTLFAIIVQAVGSWNKGTAFTLRLQKPASLDFVLDMLGKMPMVEKAEELAVKNGFPGFLKKIVPEAKTSLKKKILVTLKQRAAAREPQTAAGD